MKFKLLLISCLLTSGLASAQVNQNAAENGGNDLKPMAGSRSFEVNFSPFSGAPISLSYLKGRYFVTPDMAYRAGASIAFQSFDSNNTFEFALAPGIEWHFSGTNRLSPYYGAEMVLGGRSSSSNITQGGSTIKTSGAWHDGSSLRSYFDFSLNGLLGCDYYFSKHIFMGIEAGYGLNYRNYSQVQVTIDGESEVIAESLGTFSIAPRFNSALRLGFLF